MIYLPKYSKEKREEMAYDFDDGVYDFTVKDVINLTSSKGNMMTRVILLSKYRDYEYELWDHFMHDQISDSGHKMHKAIIKRIGSFLESIGVEWLDDVLSKEKIAGKKGKAFVHLRENNSTGKMIRSVKRYVKKENGLVLPATNSPESLHTETAAIRAKTEEFDDDLPF